MQVLLWNVEGAKSTLATEDADISNVTLIIFVETMCLQELNVDQFKCINQKAIRPVRGRPMGGITIGVNKKYQVKISNVKKTDRTVTVKLQFPRNALYVIAGYFPPQTEVDEIVSDLSESLPLQYGEQILLCGDFNCRLDIYDGRGSQLVEMLYNLGLVCLSDPKTHTYYAPNGKSTIDLAFATFAASSAV